MRYVQFTKMQGLGNDFLVVEGPAAFSSDEIAWMCDRRFGVGADGVLVVTKVDPVRMEYFNADGSAAEMCGNGLRCVARYVYDRGWVMERNFPVQTPIGVRGARVLDDVVEVELGRVTVGEQFEFGNRVFQVAAVGNPHAVTFVDDPDSVDVAAVGRSLQTEFDAGTNVEFVHVDETGITMRVWERGVGETLACGTGMAAATAVVQARSGEPGAMNVRVPGGQATVDIRDGIAWIRGPADYSFRGSVGEQ